MKLDHELLSRCKIHHLPEPDFDRLRKAILRSGIPDRVPVFELAIDDEVFSAVLGEHVGKSGYASTADGQRVAHWQNKEEAHRYVDQLIRAYYHLGYDYVILPMHAPWLRPFVFAADTARLTREMGRGWIDQTRGPIATWADFERYDWATVGRFDFSIIEYAAKVLPEGVGLLTRTQGVVDGLMRLMGLERLFYALVDDPELVKAVSDRVGEMLLELMDNLVQVEGLTGVCYADDMGFKTNTLISPADLRKYVLPWMKRYADLTHARALPFVLHSCGNVEKIMDELIDEIGIDAKHSYEDVIMPIAQVKAKYGHRIGILGGMDMDLLASATEETVRATVRQAFTDCAPGGGFALSSGNSITNYVPVNNFFAMLDEARNMGKYG